MDTKKFSSVILGVVLSVLPASPSMAQELVAGSFVQKVEINDIPSFFFKVHPNGQWIAYTVPPPGNPRAPGTNKLLNLATSQTTVIPGPHDPVFVGDTDLMVIPEKSHKTYELYRLDELVRGGSALASQTSELIGYYQSVGILDHSGDSKTVRMIAERAAGQHTVSEFDYNQKASNPSSAFNFKRLAGVILCKNTEIKLPMLSKDGRLLGGLDVQTSTSGVWEIQPDYTCKKIVDLKSKTGKLNFNADNTRVTYHIYHRPGAPENDETDDYLPLPSGAYVADIYVIDLKTQKKTRITNNTGDNSLYPDFLPDGTIVFVNHPHKDAKVTFDFVKL